MRRIPLLLGALVTIPVAAASACGSEDASSRLIDTDAAAPDATSVGDAAALPVSANAWVLVHAAAFAPFRLCFSNRAREQPLPSVELMPDSNVVGVDVGSAVRLEPLGGPLGKVFVLPEPSIRAAYPTGGGPGPTCEQLLSSSLGAEAVEVAELTQELSSGVHLLVLAGCRPAAGDPAGSVARCGPSWTPEAGNLRLDVVPLTPFPRVASALPVQAVQLSPALASRAGGRAIALGFGELDAGAPDPLVEGDLPLGVPAPEQPVLVPFDDGDAGAYASHGVFVMLGPGTGDTGDGGSPDASTDGGAREVLLARSLAEIQRLSAPADTPFAWYATAASYALLLLGDPDAPTVDGGAPDPRRALHLLAVPVAEPDADDAGSDEAR